MVGSLLLSIFTAFYIAGVLCTCTSMYMYISAYVCVLCAGIAYGGGGVHFGGGNRLIYLDNVECDGTEATLLNCRGVEPGAHNCDPSENAGVFCPSKYMYMYCNECTVLSIAISIYV